MNIIFLMDQLLILILIFNTTVLVCTPFYFLKGWFKWFYHDILQWHVPVDKQAFDGQSFESTCKHCGKKILQDSQGNWFEF